MRDNNCPSLQPRFFSPEQDVKQLQTKNGNPLGLHCHLIQVKQGHHSDILAILFMHFDFLFLPPKTFKLFGVPFFLIMYLMKVIPETYHVQLIRYLCFFINNFWMWQLKVINQNKLWKKWMCFLMITTQVPSNKLSPW